jgi:hypothetical protein
MWFEVSIGRFSSSLRAASEPEFLVQELESVEALPGGVYDIRIKKEWRFSKAQWQALLDSNGDFRTIGIDLKKDSPVEGFEHWGGG